MSDVQGVRKTVQMYSLVSTTRITGNNTLVVFVTLVVVPCRVLPSQCTLGWVVQSHCTCASASPAEMCGFSSPVVGNKSVCRHP